MSRYYKLLEITKYYAHKDKEFLKLLKNVESKMNYDLRTGLQFRRQEIKNYQSQYYNGSRYMK